MPIASSYDDWAGIYDSVYAYLTHDIPFYVHHAIASGGPVLELGCGTGRVSIPTAAAGIEVVGVDTSQPMLEVARRKAKADGVTSKCRFRQGNMCTIRLGRHFPLVTIPFRSFQSLLTVAEQRQALATAEAHLAPDAVLALDTFAPDVRMLAMDDPTPFHVQDVPQPDSGNTFVVWGQNRWDHLKQTNDARLILEELDPGGQMLRRLYRDYTLRYTFPFEMHHLLEACGFTVEAVYGDFEGGPVTSDSTDLVWLARQDS